MNGHIKAQRASILVPHDHLHNNQKRASSPESRQSMALQISLYCLSQLALTKASAVAVYALLLHCITGSDAARF